MTGIYQKRVAALSLICMMLLMAIVPAGWGAGLDNGTRTGCAFSEYLEDADNRARYEKLIAKGRYRHTISKNQDQAAMYAVIAKSGYGAEQVKNLDSLSAGCLVCHDGNSASKVRPAIINSHNNRKNAIKMSLAKHPIGMDYEKYSASDASLKSLDEMGQHLNLTEGRVSCLTCHDPLNPGKNHIRVTKSGVDLCSACHTM